MNFWLSFTWWQVGMAALVGFVICELNQYLTTAVLHRGLTHGAIAYPRWLTRATALWLWATVCVPPLTWIAAHRHHHANSDTEDDPHAPSIKGFWHVLLLTWQDVPTWAAGNRELAERLYLRPFREEKLLRFLDRDLPRAINFYGQIVVSILLGPVAIAFWVGRLVPYMLLSGYVNAAGHTFGARPYSNLGTDADAPWQVALGYFTGGEPLGHNFHHRHPVSATFRPQRFDPGYWFATALLRGKPSPASDRVPVLLAREQVAREEAVAGERARPLPACEPVEAEGELVPILLAHEASASRAIAASGRASGSV